MLLYLNIKQVITNTEPKRAENRVKIAVPLNIWVIFGDH